MKYLTKNTIAFITLSLFCSFTLLHKYYTSLSQIELNSKTGRLEIATKYFTDDLILSIEDVTQQKANLGNGVEDIKTKNLVDRYFNSKIGIKINDTIEIPFTVLGYEDNINETWVYIESDSIPADVKNISIKNESFFHYLNEQRHIIRFKYLDFLSSEILNKNLTEAEFELP